MKHKLFFFLLGCKLPNRYTEQHDVFLGIAKTPADLIPALLNFWPDAEKLHIDCWREVTSVNGFHIEIVPKSNQQKNPNGYSLFFINMGGYKKGDFEEFHHKDIFAAANQEEAIKLVKKTTFYLQNGFKGAVAHIDNKYGVDIDEIYPIEEILSAADKEKYQVIVTNEIVSHTDEIHLGYTTLSKLKTFT